MGWQKFVQYIRMLYIGFIDVNRSVPTRTFDRNTKFWVLFVMMMKTDSCGYFHQVFREKFVEDDKKIFSEEQRFPYIML